MLEIEIVDAGIDDRFVNGEHLTRFPDVVGVFGASLCEQPFVAFLDRVGSVPFTLDRCSAVPSTVYHGLLSHRRTIVGRLLWD